MGKFAVFLIVAGPIIGAYIGYRGERMPEFRHASAGFGVLLGLSGALLLILLGALIGKLWSIT